LCCDITTILIGVEKAVKSLPPDTAEEIRFETVKVVRDFLKPTDNLTRAETRALKDVCSDMGLTILPADKGNATVIFNTTDYTQKISTLLEDHNTYMKLMKDPTVSAECKTSLLLNQSFLPEEVCKKLQTACCKTTQALWASKYSQGRIPATSHCEQYRSTDLPSV
jgi:hypothetical protein